MVKGVEAQGVIVQTLRNRHRVRLTTGHECLAHESGKLITRKIRVTVGDSVMVELSPYDLTRANRPPKQLRSTNGQATNRRAHEMVDAKR